MRTNSITLKYIASILDLSVSTVSKALSNSSEISTSTKNNVIKTANALNYRPNMHASALKNKRSYILGIILPDLKDNFFKSNYDAILSIPKDVEKDDLSKMNVLRRIISPMGTMDGIEFLISNEAIPEKEKFDIIILDEAQDLITPFYLEVMDLILKNSIVHRGKAISQLVNFLNS